MLSQIKSFESFESKNIPEGIFKARNYAKQKLFKKM